MRNRIFLAGALAALLFAGPAWAANSKCDVFPDARERAQCACALQLGGWVTRVHDRWRVIYVRRHQERACHNKVQREWGSPN
ncbi:hypothetical protein [Roseiarcus sp.]|uniref:hypothetical protein n=1 Tax=Roseiarcus sp. TaxID=1969460 RepID=UPI003F9639CD